MSSSARVPLIEYIYIYIYIYIYDMLDSDRVVLYRYERTHACVWREEFMCVTWLIYTCDTIHMINMIRYSLWQIECHWISISNLNLIGLFQFNLI